MNIDIIECYCQDCYRNYYASMIDDREISHCTDCGGVNVDTYYMTLQDYLDEEHGSMEIVADFESRKEEIWTMIKNLNTDDELNEIERLLFQGF